VGLRLLREHPKPSYLWPSNVSFALIEDGNQRPSEVLITDDW